MENTPVTGEADIPKKNILFDVTTLSKVLAAVLFIMLPFAGFWVGTKYNKEINNDFQTATTPVADTQTQQPQKVISTEGTENISEGLELPENSALLSARTGVFKGYLSKKVLSGNEVQGNLTGGETVSCDTFTITDGDLSIFYKYTDKGKPVKITQDELPYEIYIGNGDIKSLPVMTQDVLLKSSPSSPVYAAITEYFNSGGKGLDTCESTIDLFVAF